MKAIKIEHCAECIFKDHSIHSYPDGHEKRYCVREDGLVLLQDWPHIPADCPLEDVQPITDCNRLDTNNIKYPLISIIDEYSTQAMNEVFNHIPDVGKMVDHSGDINKMIEEAERKAVEKVLNELQLKLIGMQTFASEKYNEIAYEGAVTVFDEIRAWIKQWKEAGK